MDKLLEKISHYEILTNLLPGAVFYIFMEYGFEVDILKNINNEVDKLIICYFMGLTIGRISSLIVEPVIRKLIVFAPYSDYIKAAKNDSKIDLLNENDHTEGVKVVLKNYDVKEIYINLPWKYTEELEKYKDDGRRTIDSINRHLKEKYKSIVDIENIAEEKDVKISSIFQGDVIADRLYVLSPSKEFYFELIRESSKTIYEHPKAIYESSLGSPVGFMNKAIGYIFNNREL